jgi:hypothetical protein
VNYDVLKLSKIKPLYKGYERSGGILFHNINQNDTGAMKTPKARDSYSQ